MVRYFAGFLAILLPLSAFAQGDLWTPVTESNIPQAGKRETAPKFYRTLSLNTRAMQDLLAQAPLEFTAAAKSANVIITLPKPDGTFEKFRLEESPMVSPKVAAQNPGWKSYSARGLNDPTATARLSWSARGLQAFVVGADGAYFVDPYATNDVEHYIVYAKSDAGDAKGSFHCGIDQYLAQNGSRPTSAKSSSSAIDAPPGTQISNGAVLRTYRLAIATTGEYTIDRGGQASAFQDVMNAVNRINLIFRRDLSVTFTLVSGADVVFPDPATDPYDNSDNLAQLDINQMQLDMIVGNANYDIGHLFGTGGGGVAFAPSVCSEIKAKGYSARVPPTGDSFWVDYVAHEIGHQFSASHTYNTLENGTCSTRSAGNAYEVASGATIMSYVGICSQRNLQQFAIDGFHVRSLTQIIAELANTNGGGATCGTPAANGNTPPTVATAAGFTIPKQTPFLLTATGSDPDPGTALTYSWEQYDLAPSATGPNGTPPGAYDNDADGVLRPLFRVYAPVTSPSRSYPSLPYILANANVPPQTFTGTSPTGAVCAPGETCVTGEVLPTVTRTMNFRVVLRDNNGGVTDAATQVNVDGASGPFVVTSPNSAVSVVGNSQINVTWDVANTSQAPINAANVKISLSTDGGQSFNTVLAPSTPNDGSEAIALPNISVTTARIKVEAVDNIFFDISDTNFTITEADPTPPATYAPLSPARVWDSRFGPGPTGLIGSGQSRDVTVTGVGGVPATGVTAVVLNVTAVNPTATTFATIWPTGEVRPLAANLNIPPGDVRPNLVIVKVGAGGQISVFNNAGNVHFVADVAGWYGATGGERYTAVSPSRVWDSRFGPGPVGQLAGGQSTNVLVTGVGGVPATGVTAVVLNVAAVRPTSQTFITGWPAGEVRPLAANLNVPPNDVRPNLVILKVGAGGQVSFFNNAGNVDLVADVAGYFSSSGSSLNSVSPSRVWDSRFGPGPTGKIGAGQSRSVTVTGVNGIPATGVTAVVLNVAAVRPTATTFVTAWPSGETRPLAANLNVPPNDVRANLVIVKVGANGQVDFFNNSGELDLVADIAGWFGAPGQ